jgi:hypothetical protein
MVEINFGKNGPTNKHGLKDRLNRLNAQFGDNNSMVKFNPKPVK